MVPQQQGGQRIQRGMKAARYLWQGHGSGDGLAPSRASAATCAGQSQGLEELLPRLCQRHSVILLPIPRPTPQVPCAEGIDLLHFPLSQLPPAPFYSGKTKGKNKKKEEIGKKPEPPLCSTCSGREHNAFARWDRAEAGGEGGCPRQDAVLGSQGQQCDRRDAPRAEEQLHHVDRGPNCSGHSKPSGMTMTQRQTRHCQTLWSRAVWVVSQ